LAEYVPVNPFAVKGRTFFNKPFFNVILATNIAIYKYLADLYFDGDMGRVVWASTEMMFRKRQEQLAARKVNDIPKDNLGILDMPFCSFRLAQDGVNEGTDRNWWNPALNVEGMWIEELGRRVRITPMTLTYEACFICQHDTDLYWAQNLNIWDKAKETILESFIDAIGPDGTAHTLKNMILYDAVPHMNAQYSERDWLEKNKLQTITMDIQCQTWTMEEDKNHRYGITKKVLFNFLEGSGYLTNLFHGEGDVDDTASAEKIVWDIFYGKNESGVIDPIVPKDMRMEVHNFTVPPGMPIEKPVQGEFDFD
jgi:hypothetical protein